MAITEERNEYSFFSKDSINNIIRVIHSIEKEGGKYKIRVDKVSNMLTVVELPSTGRLEKVEHKNV